MNYTSKRQGFDSYKNSRPLTSRAVTSKSPSSANIRKGSQTALEDDIIINTCCPNCRYIFKVVNENKLNIIKNKLKKLQTIQQEQKSVTFKDKIESVKLNEQIPINNQYYGRNEEITDHRQKSKVNQVKKPIMINQIKAHPSKNYQKRYQQSQESQNMRKDINLMKKYLDKYKNSKSPRSHNASMSQKQTPRQQNISLINYEQPLFQGAQKLSTIVAPKKQIQISRKCQKCQNCCIQYQIAKKAANSKLKQQQLIMIAPHIDKQSPSYIKCLQLIVLNE